MNQSDLGHAKQLDQTDNLSSFRDEFLFPQTNGSNDVYFVGNSLGLQPKRTAGAITQCLEQWNRLGVHGHFEGDGAGLNLPWMDLPDRVSELTAPLVGAHPDEIVIMNTLTVNLHLMMATFYQPTEKKHQILIEEHAFPSDHQAVESHLELRGRSADESLRLLSADKKGRFPTERIIDAIEEHRESLAMVLLPGVQYYTGEVLDMDAICQTAKQHGITVGLDLAHAVGNIPLQLSAWSPDFACWCNYKYVNGGPGAIGGCFLAQRHVENAALPRLAGWWGHERKTRFEMRPEFVPSKSAAGWQLSNPPILSLIAVAASLELFHEAGGIDVLRNKSIQQTQYFRNQLEANLGDAVHVITPEGADVSGCQLSLEIKTDDSKAVDGKAIFDRISARRAHTDWRYPNVIRAAPVPLYNSFEDIWRFVNTLASCMES